MKERVLRYGSENLGLAILSTPLAQQKSIGVLLANVGLTNHVGPFRQFVDLSRALAAQGIVAVRFDLSGFGDSPAGNGSVAEDFTALMNTVTTATGITEFFVLGNCLGADHAHLAALSDARIKGGIFIDGYLRTTQIGLLRYYAHRFLSLEHWRDFLGRRVFGTRHMVMSSGKRFVVREHWTSERMQRELCLLADRGFDFCFIYTGHSAKWFNHPSQLKRYFPIVDFKNRVWVKIFEKAGHTFFAVEDRHSFIESVVAWVIGRNNDAAGHGI